MITTKNFIPTEEKNVVYVPCVYRHFLGFLFDKENVSYEFKKRYPGDKDVAKKWSEIFTARKGMRCPPSSMRSVITNFTAEDIVQLCLDIDEDEEFKLSTGYFKIVPDDYEPWT